MGFNSGFKGLNSYLFRLYKTCSYLQESEYWGFDVHGNMHRHIFL